MEVQLYKSGVEIAADQARATQLADFKLRCSGKLVDRVTTQPF
jgi:hypothetical protein